MGERRTGRPLLPERAQVSLLCGRARVECSLLPLVLLARGRLGVG